MSEKSQIHAALKTASDTKDIVLGSKVLDQVGEVFARNFPGQKVLVIADENTFVAAGEESVRSLRDSGVLLAADPHIFPGKPTLYANGENVDIIENILSKVDAIACSIASGSLNDMTKLASARLGRPYMNVCTAASMDGYAAFGASISIDGFKDTRSCPAARVLVADLEVLAKAPARLTSTGYGDLIEKIPAGADWIIADVLGIEAIDPYVWDLVQGPLKDCLKNGKKIGSGDAGAILDLAQGLIMSGLAMQAYKASRPASGAGHQFSHLWEMEGHGLDWDPPLSHGQKVGLGTVMICAFYESFLSKDLSNINIEALVQAWPDLEQTEALVRALNQGCPPGMMKAAINQTRAKWVSPQQMRSRLELVVKIWPQLKEKLAAQLLGAEEIRQMLKEVGGIYHPNQIRLDWKRFQETYRRAQTMRSRYTVLDLALETGVFDQCVEEIFAPTGFWGLHRED